MNKTHLKSIAAGLMLAALASASFAHEAHDKPRPKGAAELAPEQKPWGIAGKAAAVKRTIDIAMADDMTFTPPALAAWMPNAFFLLIGLVLLRRVRT